MLTAKTTLIGLIGWPVSHSKSPLLHNAAAQALGLDVAYAAFPVRPTAESVAAAVRGAAALGMRGLNVTVPHKQAVIPLLDEVEAAAAALGAVNTIVFEQATADAPLRALGYNTDWSGFLADLADSKIEVGGRGCMVLGAGGSARAVAYALARAGGRVHLFARRIEQAAAVAKTLGPLFPQEHVSYHAWDEVAQIALQWVGPLIVNTTPLGMTPHTAASPWAEGWPFPRGSFVYDLVYNPAETKLMAQAHAAGCEVQNGLGMLVQQGAHAFARWTGADVAATAAAMRAALL